MNILFWGDIVGRGARESLALRLPSLKRTHAVDFVIANGENAASGRGITPKICQELFEAGVDVITTGNHVWDQKQILEIMDTEPRLLRPYNYPEGSPGRGFGVYPTPKGKIGVVNMMGRLFMPPMPPLGDPFLAMDNILSATPLGQAVSALVVDIHAEATSEKIAMGRFCDGRASLVVGTHTHVPTADARIQEKGCAYMTDAGMCGGYESILGMEPIPSLERFTKPLPTQRLTPVSADITLCGVHVRLSPDTGHATPISPIMLRGILPSLPPKQSPPSLWSIF